MGTTADKLNAVLASKNAIRDAITEKIGEDAGEVMSTYAEKIKAIETKPNDKVTTIFINQSITDPNTMVTLIEDSGAIQAIRDNSHRYLAKKTNDGEVTICQLDDNNSNRYSDGGTSVLTGAQGDVFMRLPEFWYHSVNIGGDIWKVTFLYGDGSDSIYKKWDGNELIGVYEASHSDNKLYSRSGATIDALSKANNMLYASNRGDGYRILQWKHHSIMAFLFFAWHLNTNSQNVCGNGPSSLVNPGATDALGMNDTAKTNAGAVNFWGLENWWSNRKEYIGNVQMSGNSSFAITNDDGSVRNVNCSTSNGYIKKLSIGDWLDAVPTEVGASTTTGYCDYYNVGANGASISRAGIYYNNQYNGITTIDAYTSATSADNNYCGRLTFRGNIVEVKDSSVFKNITALG